MWFIGYRGLNVAKNVLGRGFLKSPLPSLVFIYRVKNRDGTDETIPYSIVCVKGLYLCKDLNEAYITYVYVYRTLYICKSRTCMINNEGCTHIMPNNLRSISILCI